MKNNILLKTNLLVSVILLVGFALIATLSYRANYNASLVKIKQVSSLASEGIYYRLSTMLTKPVNISQTMAHDSLLIKLLEEEGSRYQEAGYQETIRKYLDTYKNKYAYDSVFLVSASTNNYYNFNGLDRNLARGEDENVWYYNFLQSGEEYSLNIDNDEVAGAADKITLFVNCRIRDASGRVIGVVGVGVNVDYIKGLLQEYEKEYDVATYLINEKGEIEVSSLYNGHQTADWFKVNDSEDIRSEILEWKNGRTNWDIWMPGDVQNNEKSYLVVRYIPDLSWYLLVKQDTGALLAELNEKMLETVVLISVVILLIIMGLIILSPVMECSNLRGQQYILTNQRAVLIRGDRRIFSMPIQAIDDARIVQVSPNETCLLLGSKITGEPQKQLRFWAAHPLGAAEDGKDVEGLVFYAIQNADQALRLVSQQLAA